MVATPTSRDAVAWARVHDAEAHRIADAAHSRIRQVVSVPGVYAYSERLIRSYAAKYTENRAAGRNADEIVGTRYSHEFACDAIRNGQLTQCELRERTDQCRRQRVAGDIDS